MGKIEVTANQDFFDGANQTTRVKGSRFTLKKEYAESLGKVVSFGATKHTSATTPAKQSATITKQAAPKKAATKKR